MKNPNYIVEKTVETIAVCEVLEYAPASVKRIIERVGFIPTLNRQLKYDAVRRILITLEKMGYSKFDEQSKKWSKGHRSF